jgi:hypothetical protein
MWRACATFNVSRHSSLRQKQQVTRSSAAAFRSFLAALLDLPFLVDHCGVALAELAGKFRGDLVQCCVEILSRFLSMDIGAWYSEVGLYGEFLLGSRSLIVDEHHVSGHDFLGEVFEVENLFRSVLVDGGGEAEVAGAEVELHVGEALRAVFLIMIRVRCVN